MSFSWQWVQHGSWALRLLSLPGPRPADYDPAPHHDPGPRPAQEAAVDRPVPVLLWGQAEQRLSAQQVMMMMIDDNDDVDDDDDDDDDDVRPA